MTICEALKLSNFIRRKGSSAHRGSNGTGYVHISVLLASFNYSRCFGEQRNTDLLLTREDLLADDWEVQTKTKFLVKYTDMCKALFEASAEGEYVVLEGEEYKK